MGVRTGDHIKWRGGVAHYRRVIPADCRAAYGKWEETRSLGTRGETEARRLEKRQDAQFETGFERSGRHVTHILLLRASNPKFD
jgi:hypothetical protein